jgi:hypothetical protein
VVEKAGLWPVIQAARLAERYDMAVVTSEGFAAEAPRDLLAELHGQDMTIFVLHDADHPGYNIARTLGEETARMPGHHVDVIDIGLTVDAAIGLGMAAEPYTRESALPVRLLPRLSAAARDWFTGTVIERDYQGAPKRWRCKRVELNAFTSPGLIAYIEDGLAAHGASQKVVPPRQVITNRLREQRDAEVAAYVQRAVADLIDVDAITQAVQRTVRRRDRRLLTSGTVRGHLEDSRESSWRDVADQEARARLRQSGVTPQLVAALVMGRLDIVPGGRP